jgi:hypothetical protein
VDAAAGATSRCRRLVIEDNADEGPWRSEMTVGRTTDGAATAAALMGEGAARLADGALFAGIGAAATKCDGAGAFGCPRLDALGEEDEVGAMITLKEPKADGGGVDARNELGILATECAPLPVADAGKNALVGRDGDDEDCADIISVVDGGFDDDGNEVSEGMNAEAVVADDGANANGDGDCDGVEM